MKGYAGKILYVDLSKKAKRKWATGALREEVAREYLGGRGLAAHLLYTLNPKDSYPLNPSNHLIIASGPLSGAFVPAGGKITFASKSPLTGGYGDSNMGGMLAAELKYAGYDAIVIKGRAEKLSILVIDDGHIEILDAFKYWKMPAIDTEKALKNDLGEDFQCAVIGPAGENLVRFACVNHDFGRQAGRTGMGAVMGSKNLKAICVRGTKGLAIHDIDAMFGKGKEMFAKCFASGEQKIWTKYGTSMFVNWANKNGALPVRNFKSEWYARAEEISGEAMREKIVVGEKACFGCPMPCGKYSHAFKEGKYDVFVEGPEYETIALCGSNCGLSDIGDVAYINYLCDQYGLDTISCGSIMAFAIECFQKGIITLKMTGGKKLEFGDVGTLEYLVERIANQDNILGTMLGLGTKKFARLFRGSSAEFAIHIKGLEQSGYGVRDAMAMALAYMTCDVGATHNRAWAIAYDLEKGRSRVEGKAEEVVRLQHARPLFDMMGTCRLPWLELGLPLESYPEILKAITDLDFSLGDLLKISERVWNLTRCFWKRENPDFGRSWDQPPARFLEEHVPIGPTCGAKLTQEKVDYLLNDYYNLRGWDKNGIPTKEKLLELNLGYAADDLYPE